MTDVDSIVRTGAVVAAVAVLAGPSVVAKARRLASLVWKTPPAATLDDAHTVLEIARRLHAAGSKRGVELCQQLIDVLLKPAEDKSK